MGSHNPPSFSTQRLPGTRTFLQSMWDPHRGPTSLLAHCLMSTPLRRIASSLAHRPVTGSNTICNGPSPSLADIVLFELSLKVFKTCLLGRGFHTLIKSVSFSSPTNVGSHNPPPPLQGPTSSLAHVLSPINVGPPPNPPPSGANILTDTLPRVTPFQGTSSSLAHRPVSGSDTICNDPSPPLADIVLYGLSLSGFPSRFLKRIC